MSGLRKGERNALVVIPARSIFYVIWCLDYAARLRLEGFQVDLLDLSSFSTHWHRRYFRKFMLTLLRKNRLEFVTAKVCLDNQVRFLKPLKKRNGQFPEISGLEKITFLSLLDAQYAPLIGRRVTAEDLLPEKTLRIEKFFYQKTKEIIHSLCAENRYSLIATANGRLIVSGAVKAASLETIGTCQILDTSINRRWTYQVHKPDYVENPETIPNQINELWANATSEKVSIAHNALEEKLKGYRLDAPSWASAFINKFDVTEFKGKKLAVIFPTTDWERPLHLRRDAKMTFEGDQKTAFMKFSEIALLFGYTVIVRAHPHPGDPSREAFENSLWGKFCDENSLRFISSGSGVDSYDLMKKSDLNVSYGSSVAIDSIILNRPTLVLGRSEFSHLIADSFAKNENEIFKKLQKGNLVADKSLLYPWSYFQVKGQFSIQIIQFDERGKPLYNGKEIERSALKNLRNFFMKLKKINTSIKLKFVN